MSENTPQLLIIPGSYISALAYYDLRDVIRKARPELPEALVYDLPSASSGPPLPAPTLDDDGAFFAEKIIQLADQGIDVVLLGHSYGGLVAREALKGLSKTERASQGKAGGVVHTIYISPIICEPGQTTMDTLAGITYDHFDVFDEHYVRHFIPSAAARLFSDLPEREAIRHAARGTVNSLDCFLSPATELSTSDKSIPSTFIFCTKDQMFPAEYQRDKIEVLKRQSGEDKVEVVELNAGHCPQASAPEEVAKIVAGVILSRMG